MRNKAKFRNTIKTAIAPIKNPVELKMNRINEWP